MRHHFDRSRGSSSKRGYGAKWRRLRLVVLSEEPYCRACQSPAEEVDHIVPKPLGTDVRDNLQALCKRCHSSKTRREMNRRTRGGSRKFSATDSDRAPHLSHALAGNGRGGVA